MFAIVRTELFFGGGGDQHTKDGKAVEKIHKHDHVNSSIEAGNVTSLCVSSATGTKR